jgi:hypothetical protein
LTRVVVDPGYRGHNAPPDMRFMRFKVHIPGQKRGVTDAIKRELRWRSAVEPVIGHAKAKHRMGRNFLKGSHDDVANAVLAAAGCNFRIPGDVHTASPAKAWARALEITAQATRDPAQILPRAAAEWADKYGDATALISDQERLSFRALEARMNQYSRWPQASRAARPSPL